MDNQVVTVDFSRKNLRKTTETLNGDKFRNRSRVANDELRGRKHLTPNEIEKVCTSIRKNSRNPDRDELMVLAAFHHGLRVSELTRLQWQHIQLQCMQIKINRIKNGINTTHPIASKRELILFRRMYREQGKPATGPMFRNERGNAVSTNGFQQMFAKFSAMALGIKWPSHALRHAFCATLIDRGHDLRTVQLMAGHKNIQNTLVYLHESAKQFENIEW